MKHCIALLLMAPLTLFVLIPVLTTVFTAVTIRLVLRCIAFGISAFRVKDNK